MKPMKRRFISRGHGCPLRGHPRLLNPAYIFLPSLRSGKNPAELSAWTAWIQRKTTAGSHSPGFVFQLWGSAPPAFFPFLARQGKKGGKDSAPNFFDFHSIKSAGFLAFIER
jgi:hypothetical protein